MKNTRTKVGFLFTMLFVFMASSLIGQTNKAVEDKTVWGKNIIYTPAPPPKTPSTTTNLGEQPKDMLKQITYLDNEVLPGSYYTECSWIYKAYPDKVWVTVHTHDFDEVFGMYGSDPNNPNELNGEIELWIGDEKHTITKSCLIFVPKGVKHCPLTIKRVDKPILFFTTGPSGNYTF
ncbi:MAG: hypothetical protein EHM93_09055 [Bacteroidales bacterium]|nr:MAG: hypothetical protein EHM93_09055 [Bacteroidales bacterium]